ncbi:MAG: DUF262 domain-containing protein [Deltaproteobacteria bacterium]|nr:DUF262 domain-containing protein [Deltaproteobacteria bacterium]
MSLPAPQQSHVKPEVVFIFELIRDVLAGSIRVPAFQRPFVWSRQQMRDLLDSVWKNYPLGSLLLWEPNEGHPSLERVGPFNVGASSSKTQRVKLLLDGHQRISTLVGVLWNGKDKGPNDEDPNRWRVYYNAKEDTGGAPFEHLKPGAKPEPWHYPMNRLMDTLDILAETRKMVDRATEAGLDATPWVARVETLARTFQSFKMPVIQISEAGLSEAVEIFARLNTKGQRMSQDQMFSALTYHEGKGGGFHLAQKIDDIMVMLRSHGFGALKREIVLRSILAILKEDIYSTDLTVVGKDMKARLRTELPDAVDASADALKRAVIFLKSQGIHNDRLLPYNLQVVVLAAFFHACERPTKDQERFLRRWLWASAYQTWFAMANPSHVAHLVDEFRDTIAEQKSPTHLNTLRLDDPAQPFPAAFDMRAARTRTLLSRLIALEPRSPKGDKLAEPWRQIKDMGPDALGRVCATVKDGDLRRSPANRLLTPDPHKRRQAKNWLIKLDPIKDGAILESHAITPESLALLQRGDHDAFLEARLNTLMAMERAFMKANNVTPPTDDQPAYSPVDTDDPLDDIA